MGPEDFDDEPLLALPPSPLCERCSHNLCPCCPLPWCDQLLPEQDLDSCCDGDCVVDAYDFESWQRHVAAVRRENSGFHRTMLQDGPPRPYTRERYQALINDAFLQGALCAIANKLVIERLPPREPKL